MDAESQDAFTRTDPTPLARSAGASTDREVRSSGEIRVKYGDKVHYGSGWMTRQALRSRPLAYLPDIASLVHSSRARAAI